MRQSTDLSIYNEATGFSVHARGMGGLTREALDADLVRHVREGLVIPVALVQDDPLLVRVVLGDLTPEEDEEWVGRVVSTLRIPCGTLAVEGGLDPRVDDEEAEEEGYVKYVEVPPGDYTVEILTYLHGINGEYCVEDALKKERPGAWFRRTRPDTPMPKWLELWLSDEPGDDPGHKKEWEEFAEYVEGLSEEEHDARFGSKPLIDFVIRLTQLEGEGEVSESGEDGWFEIDTGARKPDRFPLGLPEFEGDDDEETD